MQHELDHLDGILFPDRVEDSTTFCTWEMFRAYREEAWLASIRPLLDALSRRGATREAAPRVSVVVMTINRPGPLRRCLESLAPRRCRRDASR